MSIKIARGESFIDWLTAEGGETTLTNKAIADELGFGVGISRIAEMLSDLEASEKITINRVPPHPKRNPSGRVIALNIF